MGFFHLNKKLLDEAIRFALKKLDSHPQFSCYPHYSFMVQDNKILATGENNLGNFPRHYGHHTRIIDGLPKTHAEISAWKRGRGLLNKAKSWEMINIRLSRSSKVMNSAPCPACFNLMKSLGCTTIHYSTDLGFVKLPT